MSLFHDLKKSISISLVAAIASIIPLGIIIYQQLFGEFSVIVASSPAVAVVSLNGNSVGKTPLTLKLKNGSYTIGATKTGYEPLEYAMYVEPNNENLVNIQLLPSPSIVKKPTQTKLNPSDITDPEIRRIHNEIQKLRSILVLDPGSAATIPILTEKVQFQERSIQTLRDEMKDIKGQGKWYLGSMIAIIVGLLGVIASLFIANKGK